MKKAANELASVAINAVGGYSRVKIAKLKEQIEFDNQSIARNNDRFALAQEQQKTILANNSLSATERLLLLANINTTLVTVEQRLGQLETDRLSAQQFLSLAESVERPQIRSQGGRGEDRRGRDSRTGAAVGGLIGLIVGILAALLWDPSRAERRPRQVMHARRKARRGGRAGARRGGVAPADARRIPDFVDRIYVVDDASRDATLERANAAAAPDQRVAVIVHERTGGVGAAIVTGYKRALEERVDVTCVMAADNQMDPAELGGARRARSRAARSTTRRRTASSPARRGS